MCLILCEPPRPLRSNENIYFICNGKLNITGRPEIELQQPHISTREGAGELEITILNRTRMTRIIRIFTDNLIRAYPSNPCYPCSFLPRLRPHEPLRLAATWPPLRAVGAG
jgi:hypothetical protein